MHLRIFLPPLALITDGGVLPKFFTAPKIFTTLSSSFLQASLPLTAPRKAFLPGLYGPVNITNNTMVALLVVFALVCTSEARFVEQRQTSIASSKIRVHSSLCSAMVGGTDGPKRQERGTAFSAAERADEAWGAPSPHAPHAPPRPTGERGAVGKVWMGVGGGLRIKSKSSFIGAYEYIDLLVIHPDAPHAAREMRSAPRSPSRIPKLRHGSRQSTTATLLNKNPAALLRSRSTTPAPSGGASRGDPKRGACMADSLDQRAWIECHADVITVSSKDVLKTAMGAQAQTAAAARSLAEEVAAALAGSVTRQATKEEKSDGGADNKNSRLDFWTPYFKFEMPTVSWIAEQLGWIRDALYLLSIAVALTMPETYKDQQVSGCFTSADVCAECPRNLTPRTSL